MRAAKNGDRARESAAFLVAVCLQHLEIRPYDRQDEIEQIPGVENRLRHAVKLAEFAEKFAFWQVMQMRVGIRNLRCDIGGDEEMLDFQPLGLKAARRFESQ
jgi:hypothetical protein